MSRVALFLSAILCVSFLVIETNCSQAHVKSMEEMNTGVEYYQKKLYGRSIEHLNRSIQLDAENEQAHFNLAQVYIVTESWQEAARHLQRAIDLNNTVPDYHYKLGFVLFQLEQYDQAENHLRRAIEMDPSLYKVYYRLAKVYVALDRIEDAMHQYTESINRNPSFTDAYRDLGTLYAEYEFPQHSIQVFQAALEAVIPNSPQEAEIRHRLGTVYQEQGQHQDAVTEFRRALEIDQNRYETFFSLGWTYALMDQREDARLYLKKFVNAASGNEQVRADYVKAARDKLYEFGEDIMR